MNTGLLIVLSGFSGAGKGTVVKRLLEKYSGQYALSISATTRQPREGEKEGVSYFYKTEEEFQKMIADGEFIEYAQYVKNSYGTPRSYVEQKLSEGKNVILEIELQGALKVKEKLPDALMLFVMPPTAEELKNRLVGRGTEDMETIEARLSRASEEAESIQYYDYLIINDDLEECVDDIHALISSEHNKVSRNEEKIKKMKEELRQFRKEN